MRNLNQLKKVAAASVVLGLGSTMLSSVSEASADTLPKTIPNDIRFVKAIERLHLPWHNDQLPFYSGQPLNDIESAVVVTSNNDVVSVSIQANEKLEKGSPQPSASSVEVVAVTVYPPKTSIKNINNLLAVPESAYGFSKGTLQSNKGLSTQVSYPDAQKPTNTYSAKEQSGRNIETFTYSLKGQTGSGTETSNYYLALEFNGIHTPEQVSTNPTHVVQTINEAEAQALAIATAASHDQNVPNLPEIQLNS